MSDQAFGRAQFLAGLAFATRGSFSDPIAFADAVCHEFDLDPTEPIGDARLVEELDRVAGAGRVLPARLTGAAAKRYVLARDTSEVLTVLRRLDPDLTSFASIESAPDQLRSEAEALGLEVSFAELRVVDDFPAPHEGAQFAAMTYDRVDERLHGIKPGVALKRDGLRPLYSIGLMAHEFVHVAIGNADTPILARGLEEGIADLVGGVLLAQSILGQEVAETVLLNSRLRFGRNQLGRLYRDGLLGASAVVLAGGTELLVEKVVEANRVGRQVIRELEKQGIEGVIRSVGDRQKTDLLRPFAERFVSSSPDLVVSPLALLIGEALSRGDHVPSRLADLHVAEDEGARAVAELQDRIFAVVTFDEVVTSSEVEFLRSARLLRYEVE